MLILQIETSQNLQFLNVKIVLCISQSKFKKKKKRKRKEQKRKEKKRKRKEKKRKEKKRKEKKRKEKKRKEKKRKEKKRKEKKRVFGTVKTQLMNFARCVNWTEWKSLRICFTVVLIVSA